MLVTGFGPFEERRFNPSRAIAAALARDPPPGVRVRSHELPVSFVRAPRAVERFVDRHARSRPVLLLGLGLQKQGGFRFETCARGRTSTERTDNDGVAGASLAGRTGPTLRTGMDVRALARLLRASGARKVRVSDDAGGYVCERTYRALLEAGRKHGIDAVFLHVPPARCVRTSTQVRFVRAMLAAWSSSGLTRARATDARRRSSGSSSRRHGTRARSRGRRVPCSARPPRARPARAAPSRARRASRGPAVAASGS